MGGEEREKGKGGEGKVGGVRQGREKVGGKDEKKIDGGWRR